MKAIALFSGGLDSILAVKLVEKQGVEVVPVHFYTWFTGRKDKDFANFCRENYNIEPQMVDVTQEFLEVLLNPKYGYGQGMNPCIDCKIFFFRKAKEIMEKERARFVISGEVVGQRPMSQRKDAITLIERESSLKGLVLRPLCAKCLPPSIPEKEGWVSREKLEGISGRGRKRQLELAKEFGLKHIPSPAGGCLLTDPTFSLRLKQLLEISPSPRLEEIMLLKLGRLFRVGDSLLVIPRTPQEAQKIEKLLPESACKDDKGATLAAVLGNPKDLKTLAGIILRYNKREEGKITTPWSDVKAKRLPPEVVHNFLVGGR